MKIKIKIKNKNLKIFFKYSLDFLSFFYDKQDQRFLSLFTSVHQPDHNMHTRCAVSK